MIFKPYLCGSSFSFLGIQRRCHALGHGTSLEKTGAIGAAKEK